MIPFLLEDGLVTARFTSDEAALLRSLGEQLDAMLADRGEESRAGSEGDSPTDLLFAQLGMGGPESAPLDPALARLLPDAYRENDDAASEHRRLTERGLLERKIANARRVVADLGESTAGSVSVALDPAGVQAWLRSLTDLRLTIAARLGIEHDGDEGTGSDEMSMVYDWLGYVQAVLVDAIDD